MKLFTEKELLTALNDFDEHVSEKCIGEKLQMTIGTL